jgi:gamma-glutamylcyclotransferase
MFYVFAYGSNMFTPKMRVAAPSAVFSAVARLPGYVLCFNKISTKDGSGKGNIDATDNAQDEVWGVVFVIADGDRRALDESEGGYDPVPIEVMTPSGSLVALTYIAKPGRIDNTLRPYSWYRDLVVRGAQRHELHQGYIKKLEAVGASVDPDKNRDLKNRALLDQLE